MDSERLIEARGEHPEKTQLPSFVIEGGSLIEVRDNQFLKDSSPIDINVGRSKIEVRK